MVAKQNLEVLDQFETLIVSNPKCPDTIIAAVKNGKLIIRNFWNEDRSEDVVDKYTEGLSPLHRHIEFTGKVYILAHAGLERPVIFSIEEMLNGLLLKPVEKGAIKREYLEGHIKQILDLVRNETVRQDNLIK